jgi:predicted MPP superfamily phosphohydrolase
MNNQKSSKLSRRSMLKKLLSMLALVTAGPLYSFYAERNWLEINEVDLHMPKIPQSFDGLKLVHFSDLHLGFYFEVRDLERVVEIINLQQPDIICFTGDLIDEVYDYFPEMIPILKKLKAPLGKYAIVGNHDYLTDVQQVIKALEASDFKVLINQSVRVSLHGENIYIAGIDDALRGKPKAEKALAGGGENDFTILLAHEPDFADMSSRYPIQLQLSGHSHGGQIRLPLIGHIATPLLVCQSWLSHLIQK